MGHEEIGIISYAAGCAAGAVIIVASLGVLYPAAVIMRQLRRITTL